MRRVLLLLASVLALTVTGAGVAAAAPTSPAAEVGAGSVSVGGDVTTPATLTAAQLAAFPQVSLPLGKPGGGTKGTVSGALLTDVLAASGPSFGAGKNAPLRAVVTVTGLAGWRVNLAYGELDPGFGDHPALLVVSGRTVTLVVPGDQTRLRSVPQVRSITLTALAAPVSSPPAGAVTVVRSGRSVILPASTLAKLPKEHRTVTYLSGTTPQTHTEVGPSLTAVLLVAGVIPLPNVTVTAVGSDGYGATVTNGEALLGGRPLMVSLAEDGTPLAQPRLVVAGDVKGGRYVSGTVTLVVGS